MDVSKNRVKPPKFVYNGKASFLMDDLGGFYPPFKETPILIFPGVVPLTTVELSSFFESSTSTSHGSSSTPHSDRG